MLHFSHYRRCSRSFAAKKEKQTIAIRYLPDNDITATAFFRIEESIITKLKLFPTRDLIW